MFFNKQISPRSKWPEENQCKLNPNRTWGLMSLMTRAGISWRPRRRCPSNWPCAPRKITCPHGHSGRRAPVCPDRRPQQFILLLSSAQFSSHYGNTGALVEQLTWPAVEQLTWPVVDSISWLVCAAGVPQQGTTLQKCIIGGFGANEEIYLTLLDASLYHAKLFWEERRALCCGKKVWYFCESLSQENTFLWVTLCNNCISI